MMRIIKIHYRIIICSADLCVFAGCQNNSKYPFTDISWSRKFEQDIETIRFSANVSFSYSCSCRHSVNDSDLCDGYSYDDETKMINT